MRRDSLGCYGSEKALSPELDRVAANGTVFDDHYTNASYSGGAFASLITGKYCHHHGIFDHPKRLADEHSTLAEHLASAGYVTAGFTTHIFLDKRYNYDRGCRVYRDDDPDAASMGRRATPAQNTNDARHWIRSLDSRQFFLWFQLQVTHFPYEVPKRFVRTSADQLDLAVLQYWKDDRAGNAKARLMFDYDSFAFSDRATASAMVLYESAVNYADYLTGAVLNAVRDRGWLDECIVVITTDHGECLGEHGHHFNHDANVYEPVVRVPLIVKLPKSMKQPERIKQVTRHVDLVPTILDLAGVDLPTDVDGESLKAMFSGSTIDLPAFGESRPWQASRAGMKHYEASVPGVTGKIRMVRKGDYKLLLTPRADGDVVRLFNVATDPGETVDLAATKPQVRDGLRRLLDHWFAGYAESATPDLQLSDEERRALRSLGYTD